MDKVKLNAVLHFTGIWFVKNASGPVMSALTREEMREFFPGANLPERPERTMTCAAVRGDMRLLKEPKNREGANLFRHVRVDFGEKNGTAYLAFPWKIVQDADGGLYPEGIGIETMSMLEALNGGDSVCMETLLMVDMSRMEPGGKGSRRSLNPFTDDTYRVKDVLSFLPLESPGITPTP